MAGHGRARFGRLFLLGLALAYAATGFLDKPAPIHFHGGLSSSGQSLARESDARTVLRVNVFKLGDPLSVYLLQPESVIRPGEDWGFKGEAHSFPKGSQ